jgi:acetolactate synthase small subunit
MVLSLAAEEKRVDGLIRMFKNVGIIEMARSGILAVSGVD